AAGLITEEKLSQTLSLQAKSGGKLGEVLVQELVLTEDQIAEALARQKGLTHVSLTVFPIDRNAASLVPERIARLRSVLPIAFSEDRLVLAMADPLDIEAIDDVEVRTGYRVEPVVAAPTQIQYAIEKYVASIDAFQELVDHDLEADESGVEVEGDDVPVVRVVNQFIREAVRDGASDIHVEPVEDGLRVRFRIDGVLHDVTKLPKSARAGVLSRLKILAEMDIAERRRPQDGRIALKVDDRPVDLRVASLPTPFGESIVIRILNSELQFHSLQDLGMNDHDLALVARLLGKPYGSILLAGPTGSGKSTTLYAALKEINFPTRKIITIEDPIEYRMAGITQMAVNSKIGLSFAAGLRQILRSDPDVVMVGEIRDPETAEIAVRAALTGHLVLASLHTNDAPSALTRLVDMDVPPYITSSAIVGVVAQRLARKLCPHCKVPLKLPKERLLAAGFTAGEVKSVATFGPQGCEQCHNSGYRGRLGLFEIMAVDDDIVRAFLVHAPSDELRRIALGNGMVPLRRDALEKVAAGVTSLEEIDRVVV
ncbi:MAG: ATPase, T2SS/T4P/T4SS family, partial [Actinomycetota bacterium]|nr:ATPase, T2SS/T4P/T4SS family [Actinomycetota bacterium]